ncbi:hypothetical protein QAD02_004626 [Eretmocerus hayati]|uniref:Uncharacterized protein n=1 Tax=Eretmocerus hayati TaxID=131215 RepID=A0ACC2NQJ5_9HYME|nr:hypothetical protein QAD02_004626 [Eretmocerus hayati]
MSNMCLWKIVTMCLWLGVVNAALQPETTEPASIYYTEPSLASSNSIETGYRGPTQLPAGKIIGIRRLERSKSPYVLREDLEVMSEGELQIEAGVELRVAPMIGITIRGVITAEGEELQASGTSHMTIGKITGEREIVKNTEKTRTPSHACMNILHAPLRYHGVDFCVEFLDLLQSRRFEPDAAGDNEKSVMIWLAYGIVFFSSWILNKDGLK